MIEGSALAHFLSDWGPFAKHDLSASEARPVGLSDLLALAEPDDEERWRTLRLDYADPRGAPWLRAEIARRFNGLSADHVVCCAGAQEALVCVAQALLGPHDHAVVVVPVYGPSERAVTSRCSATGVALSGQGWSLDLDRVADAIRPQTKAIFVNFPNSPTGATIDPNTMTRLIALCRLHGLWLVNDEVYSLTDTTNLSWPPAASLYERAVSVSAVSKSYGLPGVRVGWAVCRDRAMLSDVMLAKNGLSSCIGGPNQVLAHIGLRAEACLVERSRAISRNNLALLQAHLSEHLDVFEAEPSRNLAFCSWRYRSADCARNFAVKLVETTGVMVLPWSLWRSPLATFPTDRVRFGLGSKDMSDGIAALAAFLSQRSAAVWS